MTFDNCLLLIVLSKAEVKKPRLSASQFSLHGWTRTRLMTSSSLLFILIRASCKSIGRWQHKETTGPRNFPKHLLSKRALQCQCHSQQSLKLHHENRGVEEWTKNGSYECSEEQELRMKLIPMTQNSNSLKQWIHVRCGMSSTHSLLRMGVNSRAVQYIHANRATAQEWFSEKSKDPEKGKKLLLHGTVWKPVCNSCISEEESRCYSFVINKDISERGKGSSVSPG